MISSKCILSTCELKSSRIRLQFPNKLFIMQAAVRNPRTIRIDRSEQISQRIEPDWVVNESQGLVTYVSTNYKKYISDNGCKNSSKAKMTSRMTSKNISKCFHYFQSLVTRHVLSRDHLEKERDQKEIILIKSRHFLVLC